jgi:hypothetical protein
LRARAAGGAWLPLDLAAKADAGGAAALAALRAAEAAAPPSVCAVGVMTWLRSNLLEPLAPSEGVGGTAGAVGSVDGAGRVGLLTYPALPAAAAAAAERGEGRGYAAAVVALRSFGAETAE